jgi:hypothetical protein
LNKKLNYSVFTEKINIMNRKLILSVILLGFTFSGLSYNWDNNSNGMVTHGDGNNQDDSRAAGCSNPTDFIYLNFNNVKARIETGGLMWQDRSSGASDYKVPGNQEIAVIYAGALWMGGEDINGQLKLAAQKFGSGRDFWTGPLSTNDGSPGNAELFQGQPITADIDLIRAYGDAEIIPEECAKYDQVFTIRKTEITQFITYWNCTYGIDIDPADCEDVPDLDAEILGRIMDWPAHGDPALGQDFYLAPFYDNPNAPSGANGVYDPIGDGDYPWYDINKDIDCENDRRVTLFGDETNWWVFNDKGNIHTETGGDPIGMEIRAQAFTFATNDAINDMTFYNYELINRGTQTLYNTYFSQYVDPDIGGSSDDYVGCDVSRGLGYAYNGDANDNGTGGATWGLNPPAVGVDFFEGPYQDVDGVDNPLTTVIADAIANKGIPYKGLGIGYGDNVIDNERMGMRRFTYYTGGGVAPQTDPSSAAQYYGFMQGFWGSSGLATTYGGSGLNGSVNANYMFPGDSDPLFWSTDGEVVADWSEVSENNPVGDRRFVQSAGPFTLKPGAVNNLTVGVVYGRSYEGDVLASVRAMKRADTKAQSLFDACFKIIEPPLAPTLTIQELENELVLFLASPAGVDNIEEFEALDEVNIPQTDNLGNPYDQYYRFQGYQIFQMIDEVASISDITNNSKARLVGQCDLEDGVSTLVNYELNEATNLENGAVMVNGSDNGLRHSFHITEDLFASGSRTLVNHKKYYFIAVAYGYNGFKDFIPGNPANLDGQKVPYLVSRQSGNGSSIKSVLGIPHNVTPEANGTVAGTYYGWSPKVTQVDGLGNGGRFVNLDIDSEAKILSDNSIAEPVYALGQGPIDIKVVDPLNVRKGEYTLSFANDADDYIGGVKDDEKWTVTRTFQGVTENILADYSIGTSNEQIIPEWGISINIKQIYYDAIYDFQPPSVYKTAPIDGKLEFEDSSKMWLTVVTDNDQAFPTNWIRSGTDSRSQISDGGNWVDAPTCSADLWFRNDCYYDDYGNDNSGESKNNDPDQLFESILDGGIAPFKVCGFQTYGMPLGSPGSTNTDIYSHNGRFKVQDVQKSSTVMNLNDVDIVFTSDKANWTRCVVFEINDNQTQTIGGADVMELRESPSVDKEGNASSTENGRGWFPGYAIDVTTGERLNMAFSENSWLAGEQGDDMIWNPTDRLTDNVGNPLLGGMHFIYVFGTNDDMPVYDEGNFIFDKLSGTAQISDYKNVFKSCQWIVEPMLAENHTLLETDARIKMRVNKPYAINTENPGDNLGRPMYKFVIDENSGVQTNNNEQAISALDLINIVPNPYYAYNSYETGKLDTRVKITNLPEICNVTIYNMQGALIRQFSKDDALTSLDWDLKNHRGIPIAGGMYIIHIDVEGVGEKVLKWFGALRAPDLDNL